MSLKSMGKVYLIGAGPGNPNLLTKKAERIIRNADVILYDRLVNPLILQYSSFQTELIDVGKKPYCKHIQQEDINLKIVQMAEKYQCVVRLKGGDPAIFGRVTEEINTLKSYGIEHEIIPGVTSASAAVAPLNIGLTMRGIAPSVTFSTGHFKESTNKDIDIRNLMNGGTLAIYMGIKRLGAIIEQIKNYTSEDYPIAIVFNATCYNQKVITGKLSTIEQLLNEDNSEGQPGICILGPLVNEIDKMVLDSTMEDVNHILYVINGDKENAMLKAEALYEEGKNCLLNFDNSYHHTQQVLYKNIMDQHDISYIQA